VGGGGGGGGEGRGGGGGGVGGGGGKKNSRLREMPRFKGRLLRTRRWSASRPSSNGHVTVGVLWYNNRNPRKGGGGGEFADMGLG